MDLLNALDFITLDSATQTIGKYLVALTKILPREKFANQTEENNSMALVKNIEGLGVGDVDSHRKDMMNRCELSSGPLGSDFRK